jgi:hypothetical protein
MDVVLDNSCRPRQCRHDTEAVGNQAHGVERCFADADDGFGCERPGSIQTGVIEAGDDMGLGAVRLGGKDLLQKAGNRQRSVERPLNCVGAAIL